MKTKFLFILFIVPFAHSEELLVKFKKNTFMVFSKESKVAERVYKFPADQLMSFDQSDIEWVQKNHQLTLRSDPNDPEFSNQWSLKTQSNGADVGVSELWDKGVGGHDRYGREVVVAVVDGGVDTTHEDLKENIWNNSSEVPDNNIDDDGNGYIDDIHGWNAGDNSGEMTPGNHGTHVAGIIGASGHNNVQVSGVNWKVKILSVVLNSFRTDEVLKGYQYIIDLKKQWINSEGKKGANIVATNSSFGVDYAKCDSGDFPAWNDFYNQMGELGILSAAATANNDVDVDKDGDVPTGCTSPYIVAVTNTTKANRKFDSAGYGKESVDIGAPGTNILSTVIGNKLDHYTGTSMATPHVTGAIGLLYSLAPESFLKEYDRAPGKSILKIKKALIEGVDPNPDLKSKTVSGGKLSILNSFDQI